MASEETTSSPQPHSLEDIIVDSSTIEVPAGALERHGFLKQLGSDGPSCIITDWLYLGDRFTASNRDDLVQRGITHILNVTETIPMLFPDTFQYGNIKIADSEKEELYDYFEAACQFIDLCNPHINTNNKINKKTSENDEKKENNTVDNKEKKYKILVHCAMGISRSATIVMSYLMSRNIVLNENDWDILIKNVRSDIINYENVIYQTELKLKRENEEKNNANKKSNNIFTKMNSKKNKNDNENDDNKENDCPFTMENSSYIDIKKDEIFTYEKSDQGNGKEMMIKGGMTLAEAFMYVVKKREIVCPNLGFRRQLERWEKLQQSVQRGINIEEAVSTLHLTHSYRKYKTYDAKNGPPVVANKDDVNNNNGCGCAIL